MPSKDELLQAMARGIEDNMVYVVSKREAKTFAQAALTAIIEAGYAVVPREASEGMVDAVPRLDLIVAAQAYTAMIQAGEIKP